METVKRDCVGSPSVFVYSYFRFVFLNEFAYSFSETQISKGILCQRIFFPLAVERKVYSENCH